MNAAILQAQRSALILFLFSLVTTAVLSVAHYATRDTIAANENAARQALLLQVLPAFDRAQHVQTDELPLSPQDIEALNVDVETAVLYRAQQAGTVMGYAVETVAPNGYAGKIRLLVGFRPDGQVQGVRVISHKETPGLGDYIDRKKSDWIEQFSRIPSADAVWKVKKDGGNFDYMAGATISARAVTQAVGRAHSWFIASVVKEN